MIQEMGLSLILTLALELPVALLWKLRGWELLLCVLVNLMTNPAVGLGYRLMPCWETVLLLEAAAAAAEGFCYDRAGIRRPWMLSLTANGVSFGLGCVINGLL